MGNFANTLFRLLLGWVQGAASMIWTAMTSRNGESFLQFIGKNWIIILLILCAVGLIADFSVYLFRWEPWKVWRTFLRRNRKQPETELTEEAGETFFRTEAAGGREDRNRFTAEQDRTEEAADDLQRWRESRAEETGGDRSPETTRAGYTVPANSPYRRPDARNELTGIPEGGERKTERRRHRFRGILGDPAEDEGVHYYAPRPVIDQKEAYHPPVFPEKWQGGRERES